MGLKIREPSGPDGCIRDSQFLSKSDFESRRANERDRGMSDIPFTICLFAWADGRWEGLPVD